MVRRRHSQGLVRGCAIHITSRAGAGARRGRGLLESVRVVPKCRRLRVSGLERASRAISNRDRREALTCEGGAKSQWSRGSGGSRRGRRGRTRRYEIRFTRRRQCLYVEYMPVTVRLSRARAFGQRLYRTCQGRWKGVSKGAGPQAMGRAHEEAALRLFPPSTSWPRM
jgi:hypothetical protein